MKRASLYMRVSSLDQHPETQLYDLRLIDIRAWKAQLGISSTDIESDIGAHKARAGLLAKLADLTADPSFTGVHQIRVFRSCCTEDTRTCGHKTSSTQNVVREVYREIAG